MKLETWNLSEASDLERSKPMTLSDLEILELFKLLDNLGELSEEDLLGRFTSENIEALRLVSEVLKEDMEFERMLSEKRFLSVVRELFETKNIWFERLHEMLGNAALEFEKGNRVQALWILSGFIRFCPSPYFREMAEEMMEEYEKQ